VDSIVLTTDSKYIPPNEPPTNTSSLDDLHSRRSLRFSDNFCSAPSGQSRLPAGWSTDEPFWRSFRYDGVSSIGPIRAGVTVARAQHVVLQNPSIDCAFSLTPRTGAGIVFGQTAEGDNFVARVASHHASKPYAAQLEVGIQRPDEFETLQSVSCDLGCDEWHVMRVRMWGRFCQISLDGTPRLSLRLPNVPKGYAGLHVDGIDPMLSPEESFSSFSESADEVATVMTSELEEQLGSAWPGLAVGCAPEEMYIARFTNIRGDGQLAKRIELVRTDESGKTAVLSEQWGVFYPEDAQKLELVDRENQLTVKLNHEELCSAKVDPHSTRSATVFRNHPRVLFGDFQMESTPAEISTHEANAPTTAGSAQSRQVGMMTVAATDLEQAIVSMRFDDSHFPCQLYFRGTAKDRFDVIQLGHGGDRHFQIEFQAGQARLQQSVWIENNVELSGPCTIQLIFRANEVRAFANGFAVLTLPRVARGSIGEIKLELENETRTLPDSIVGADNWKSYFLAIGEGWPTETFLDRVLYGDVRIDIHGRWPTRVNDWSLKVHQTAEQEGYEIRPALNAESQLQVLRNGQRIGLTRPRSEGTKSDSYAYLKQEGRMFQLVRDGIAEVVKWERSPLRSGGCTIQSRNSDPKESLVNISQSWDAQGIFYQDMGADAALALWEPVSGHWMLRDEAHGPVGILLNSVVPDADAQLRFRPRIDRSDILAEVRIFSNFIEKGTRLLVEFELDNGKFESLELVGTVSRELAWKLRRRGKVASGSCPTLRYATICTILRTEDRFSFNLDHIHVGDLEVENPQCVSRLSLSVNGPEGSHFGIISTGIQLDPLNPDRTPEKVRSRLAFYREAMEIGY